MKCHFCYGQMEPLYEVQLGQRFTTLHRCEECLSCLSDPPFSDEEIQNFYCSMYFSDQEWGRRKNRLLANDYLKKYARLGDLLADDAGPILEIGAGYGQFAADLAALTGRHVDILEPSDACRRYITERMSPCRIVGKTLADLTPDACYSRVYCFHVVEHLPRLTPFLKQLAEHMTVGGRLWMLTPNAAAYSFRRFGDRWGWAATEHHYEFLSDRIPMEYYHKLGFTLLSSEVLQPAIVHYPSAWLTIIGSKLETWGSRKDLAQGLSRAMWTIPCRALGAAYRGLNSHPHARAPLLWAEIALTRFLQRPFDELSVVLERRQNT